MTIEAHLTKPERLKLLSTIEKNSVGWSKTSIDPRKGVAAIVALAVAVFCHFVLPTFFGSALVYGFLLFATYWAFTAYSPWPLTNEEVKEALTRDINQYIPVDQEAYRDLRDSALRYDGYNMDAILLWTAVEREAISQLSS